MTTWIDTHCHLTERYVDDDVETLVSEATEAGVSRIVNIGCGPTLDDCREAVNLAERFESVWATVGMHPHEADGVDEQFFEGIRELAKHPKVVAIGETGLDYHYENSTRDNQRRSFRRHFELAREVNLPVVIHNRDSDEDCIDILNDVKPDDVGGVVHCFSASWELARTALDHGFFLGFTGIATFNSAESVREVLRKAPNDRIVVETDSPFLAPVPHRGKRNRPKFVADVGRSVAETLGLSVEETAELTTRNACRLYGWEVA
jgi:TatD DNase family protein